MILARGQGRELRWDSREFLRLSPVFEVFLGAFAACGVFFRGLIYLLELWAVLTDHGMQVLICSNCCPPCAGSIFSLVHLGLLRPVFVVVQQWEWLPLGAGYHARVDPASEAGRSECPCRVVLSIHQRSKCQVGALPLDWVRIAAEFDRCAHGTGRKADRHTWVEMSGRLHMQKGLFHRTASPVYIARTMN